MKWPDLLEIGAALTLLNVLITRQEHEGDDKREASYERDILERAKIVYGQLHAMKNARDE